MRKVKMTKGGYLRTEATEVFCPIMSAREVLRPCCSDCAWFQIDEKGTIASPCKRAYCGDKLIGEIEGDKE